MTLSIECQNVNMHVRCVLEGELDLASQDLALAELLPVIDRRSQTVVLDLSKVEFIDSTGLRVLLRCRNHAEETGTRLVLGQLSPAVERLFEVTKIGGRFDYLQDE